MEFYSFRFGDMKTAQADASSQKTIAVEMSFGFKAPDPATVEAITLTVHVPHAADKTLGGTEEEAYRQALALLRAAADYCGSRDAEALFRETERNKAFAVKAV